MCFTKLFRSSFPELQPVFCYVQRLSIWDRYWQTMKQKYLTFPKRPWLQHKRNSLSPCPQIIRFLLSITSQENVNENMKNLQVHTTKCLNYNHRKGIYYRLHLEPNPPHTPFWEAKSIPSSIKSLRDGNSWYNFQVKSFWCLSAATPCFPFHCQ